MIQLWGYLVNMKTNYKQYKPVDSIVINSKVFFYDCIESHEHDGYCLTQSMLDALEETLYADAE